MSYLSSLSLYSSYLYCFKFIIIISSSSIIIIIIIIIIATIKTQVMLASGTNRILSSPRNLATSVFLSSSQE